MLWTMGGDGIGWLFTLRGSLWLFVEDDQWGVGVALTPVNHRAGTNNTKVLIGGGVDIKSDLRCVVGVDQELMMMGFGEKPEQKTLSTL